MSWTKEDEKQFKEGIQEWKNASTIKKKSFPKSERSKREMDNDDNV
jgi:hypothetical protein